MKKALLALVFLLLAPAAFANPFGWIVVFVPLNPGVVAGAGGTQWTTSLWVSNTSDQSFPLICEESILLTPPLPCPAIAAHSTTIVPIEPYASLSHQGFFLNVGSLFGNFVPADSLDITL